MFEWVDEVESLMRTIDRPHLEWFREAPLRFARNGATESALDEAERRLGVTLPASYRAFLTRWDGSDPESGSHRFLGLSEVLDKASDASAPFRPFQGRPRRADAVAPECDDYYGRKPAHWLFFYAHALGSDGMCFDARGDDPDYAVWCYDPETVDWNEAGDAYAVQDSPMWQANFLDLLLAHVSEAIDDKAFDAVWDRLEALLKQQYAAAGLPGYGIPDPKTTRCP